MDSAETEAAFMPAARAALESFPVGPADVVLVAMAENVTFKVVDRRDGTAYVLRLHRPGYHTLEELNAERAWVRALAAARIEVPVPVAARDGREYVPIPVAATGETRFAGLARWTEGRVLWDLLEETTNPDTVAGYFEKLGAITATMHEQSVGWTPPAGFKRHALDRDGLMGDAPFWGPFWDHASLTDVERRLLLDTRGRIQPVLDALGKDPSIYGVIHADMHAGNILVNGDRLTVIDFDDAAFGWHQYDIAVALLHKQDGPEGPALERAFLRGYRAARPIDEAALSLLPMFRLIRGMVQIGWYHQRPELPPSPWFEGMKALVLERCATFVRPRR